MWEMSFIADIRHSDNLPIIKKYKQTNMGKKNLIGFPVDGNNEILAVFVRNKQHFNNKHLNFLCKISFIQEKQNYFPLAI